jgi:hypothetical protein
MSILQGAGLSKYVGAKANVLGAIYTRAYAQLIREMNDFARTPADRARAQFMLARVNAITATLSEESRKFIEKEIPAVYFTTAAATKDDVAKYGIAVAREFSQVHFQAVQASAADAMLKFGHTMTGIKRSAEEVVQFASQKAIREIAAAGQVTGAAAADIAKEVEAKIREDGITALVDKGGKRWELDTYANTLTRQVLSNGGRAGVYNTAQEYGFDLVKISVHGTECELCKPWEGEILSLTGKTEGYDTLQDAEDAGLFHVHCKHGYAITRG